MSISWSALSPGSRTRRLRRSLEAKLQDAYQALEHFRNASKEQRDQDARRHEQLVQQLQAEIRQANQALLVKQGKITQLNKDGAGLVVEIAASAKRIRDPKTRADQFHTERNQPLVNQARTKPKRDALRSTIQQQADAEARPQPR